MNLRTYGWIQNPSDFNKLRKTVEIFDSTTEHYNNLRKILVPQQIIYFKDIRNNLLKKLNNNETEFSYKELVGSSCDKKGNPAKSRSKAEANSLIQISLLPQQHKKTGKKFSDNWTSDGFLRWAVSLNLVEANREKDTFSITPKGKKFILTKPNSKEETRFLRKVFLSYPPATRVLEILSNLEKKYFSKFEIGSKLGFIGEGGFTSYDYDLMLDWLKNANSKNEVRKIKSDIEGTSDKYARMICSWLEKVDLVKSRRGPEIDSSYTHTGFKEYYITGKGMYELKQSKGNSSNAQQEKFIMWEFLGVKGAGREYNRTRRATILKTLEKTNSYKVLLNELDKKGFNDSEKVILNDIKGLNNIGLRIKKEKNKIYLLDKINNFSIPDINLNLTDGEKSNFITKEKFLNYIDFDKKYLELLDIAYDRRRSRDFEMLTTSLLKNICKFSAKHLGGQREPDGIAYTDSFGFIFDTKAYKNGYKKSINQADQMIRYVKDYRLNDFYRNKNHWWLNFPKTLNKDSIYFIWISGSFSDNFNEQILYTSKYSGSIGAAISVEQLLIGANMIFNSIIDTNDIENYFKNQEIFFDKDFRN